MAAFDPLNALPYAHWFITAWESADSGDPDERPALSCPASWDMC
ncbi:hypothetical protein [Smaragdicoccus niigatensis]|nr:hypothetical protein [Smaragdicoccus niigatensis]